MASIEIKHDEYVGGIKSCHECTIHSWRCPMSKRIHTDPAGFYRPGPNCPGPGLYRMVSEEKIEETRKLLVDAIQWCKDRKESEHEFGQALAWFDAMTGKETK